MAKLDRNSIKFSLVALFFQGCLIILFAFLADYDHIYNPVDARFTNEAPGALLYSMFTDVHVMMFVGFGFLLVFPYLYSWSAVAFNFMMGAFVLQWSLLTLGFFEKVYHGNYTEKIELTTESFIFADYCVAAILISYSGVLGRLSPLQYLIMAFFETMVYSVNEYIVYKLLHVADIGGSMVIHSFGAYFGLGCSFTHQLFNKNIPKNHPTLKTSYSSDLIAFIGTLFLWMFWPSFNAATSSGAAQSRTVTNTLLAMAASCFVTFAWSKILRRKFAMVDLQNASLSGGVAIGAAADMMVHSWGALLTGSMSGTISTLGYVYLSPFLEKYCGLLDTAGIHNLHGMPGVLGGFVSVFSVLASKDSYGNSVGLLFPMRAPSNVTLAAEYGVEPGYDWTSGRQAGAQACGIFVSIFMGLIGGLVVGAILRLPFCGQIEEKKMYNDFEEFLIHEPTQSSDHKVELSSDEEDEEEIKTRNVTEKKDTL